MEKIKQYKYLILIAILFLGLAFYWFEWRPTQIQKVEDLKFDIDLNKLNYPLPLFNKICIPSSKQYCQSGLSCSPIKPSVFFTN